MKGLKYATVGLVAIILAVMSSLPAEARAQQQSLTLMQPSSNTTWLASTNQTVAEALLSFKTKHLVGTTVYAVLVDSNGTRFAIMSEPVLKDNAPQTGYCDLRGVAKYPGTYRLMLIDSLADGTNILVYGPYISVVSADAPIP